jgi:hypothetical protein
MCIYIYTYVYIYIFSCERHDKRRLKYLKENEGHKFFQIFLFAVSLQY